MIEKQKFYSTRHVTNYSLGILGKPDSTELWEQITLHIPDEVLLKPDVRILNVACGHGTEADILVRRMQSLGITNQQIKDSIYLIDKYQMFTNVIKRKGYENIITCDYLKWETNMKFDVVMGNPPYLKRTWLKFAEKCISISSGIVITINPDPLNNDSYFGKKWKSLCESNGLTYRKNVTNYFPEVKSGKLSAFILEKNKKTDKSLLNSDDVIYENLLKKITISQPNSFVFRGKQNVSGYGDKSKKFKLNETKTEYYCYPCIMSCTNKGLVIKYSNEFSENKKHKDLINGKFIIMNRFFGKNKEDPCYTVENIENYNLGYDCLAFKLDKNETLENFLSVYTSKLYKLMINKIRNGGFDITQSNFMRFEKLDLTKNWTDEEIYKHFNLTEQEIQYIESSTK